MEQENKAESLRKNAAQDSIPIYDASEGKEKEFLSTEENLFTTKLKEECDDADHSLKNTKRLNKIYSQLMGLFFGGLWFYLWVLLLLFLFVATDDEYSQVISLVHLIYKKLFYALGIIFVALLTFPTAKGLRRLFEAIVEIIKHKIKLPKQ
ncbi:hypothetical protein [Helicobacter bilis]|uniref:Uncharacterized protein n=2 Tax=Helicobacter bilis TaxID=37372 RepID=A0A6D2C8S0_9HELI|nr:hypothetical protein [Helicobacter bilis]EMZ37441.1 hypothetical protein C826_02005 [Helicobacter bilis WiWa]TLE05300.1 hypothetical protein LS77_003550 [Helicobacter bilis]TLE06422.1 hypothetical protein LS76_002845 [Helicobacter bilis]